MEEPTTGRGETREKTAFDCDGDGGGRGQYWLTRVVFLRCLGCIYLVAFLVALNDNAALLGEDGLLPATRFMSRLHEAMSQLTDSEKILKVPTIFWVVKPTEDNLWWVAAAGSSISLLVAWRGAANCWLMLVLWGLYHSLVNIGQTWYSYGWESQLLETGFLAIFMVPWFSLSRFPAGSPPPLVCVWGCRWLLFRVMLGAGLIKVRGDTCWMDLTCTDYHYQTQPNPNPLSLYMHHALPSLWHKGDVVINHIVELVIPWGLLLTRRIRFFAGSIQIAFQAALIISGNLSFLNWLTALPAVFSFDDGHIGRFFSAHDRRLALMASKRTAIAPLVHAPSPGETGIDGKATGGAEGGDIGGSDVSDGDEGALDTTPKMHRNTGDGRSSEQSAEVCRKRVSEEVKEKNGSVAAAAMAAPVAGGNLRRRTEAGANGKGSPFDERQHTQQRCQSRHGRKRCWKLWIIARFLRFLANLVLLGLVAKGSIPVVKNMVTPEGSQVMNGSFDSFRIVNTYGAFGAITKQRNEIILKGTTHHDPFDPAAEWREYEFKCKPGGIDRRPCVITPFHYRLDWQMWFAAFQSYHNNPWLVNLAAKLLSPDRDVRSRVGALLLKDPFSEDDVDQGQAGAAEVLDGRGGGRPPRFIRADLYHYEFTKPDWSILEKESADAAADSVSDRKKAKDARGHTRPATTDDRGQRDGIEAGIWWTRSYTREYMPAVSLENDSMHRFLRSFGLD